MVRTAAVLGFVAPAALTLLLSGCGGGSDDDKDTIAEIAVAAPELATLVAALTATDLVSAVNGTDKLTVFAPTNDAFSALGNETLSCLLAPVGLPTLKKVLEYHVVPTEAEASDLTNKESLTTLDGNETLTVMIANDTVSIKASNTAKVIKADILASNGVVHEVDAVLIPDDFTAPQCGSGSIAETAEANKDLTTLTAALGAAKLVDTLDGSTVYTVFAPTDEAFAKLGDTVACLLKPENLDALTQVLEYHVVEGYDLSSAITDGLKVATLEKEDLTFSTAGGKVTLTTTSDGTATVTTADVYASNGVVHVIDAVLLPKDFTDNNPCSGPTKKTTTTTPAGTASTIADVASGAPELKTLVTALTAADLIPALSGADKLTVFAPTDTAFAQLDKDVLNCLLAPVGVPTLTDILKLHVVPGEAKSTDLTDNESLKTLDGTETLNVMLSKDTVTIKASNPSEVIKADILASNGVVHEVDAVLIPDDFTAPQCGSGSIAETAEANKDLTTLTAALGAAKLVDTLDGSTVYTVFAPTDEAFAKLGDATVQCLLKPENLDALTQVLEYHVVDGYDLSSAITDGLKVATLEKEDLTFSTAGGKVTLTTASDGTATVTTADVYASNGVVHVIDAVLLPKDFTDSNPCATIMV